MIRILFKDHPELWAKFKAFVPEVRSRGSRAGPRDAHARASGAQADSV